MLCIKYKFTYALAAPLLRFINLQTKKCKKFGLYSINFQKIILFL